MISPRMTFGFALLAAFAASAGAPAMGEERPPPRYETDVAPILKANCVRCHNTQSMKAELDLSTPHGIFKGSKSGADSPGRVLDGSE